MTTLSLLGGSHALTTVASIDLADSLGNVSVAIVGAAVIALIAFVVALVMTSQRWPKFKAPLFTLIVLITVVTTLALGSLTVTINFASPTAGPVHWGADYQIWACSNQLNLRDPRGLLSDRIGSPTLYEKNDGRIHYDGTPMNLPDDASLGKFMQVVGGEISDSSLVVPMNDQNGFTGTPSMPEQLQPYIKTTSEGATASFVDSQRCGDTQAVVQAFVYSLNQDGKTYTQTKLTHPATYELSRSKASPPGDCVIVEFAPPSDHTDHLCASYGVRDYDRCTEFGIAADKISSCDLREVR